MPEEPEAGHHRHGSAPQPQPQVEVDLAPAPGLQRAPHHDGVQADEGPRHPHPAEDRGGQGTPQGQVAPVAGDGPQEEVPGPERQGGDADQGGGRDRGPGHAPPPRSPVQQEGHRQGGQHRRLLAQAGQGQAQPRHHRLLASGGNHRRGHGQEHEHLEAGRLGVGREVGRRPRQEEHPRGQGHRPLAGAALGLEGEEQGGGSQRHRAHRPHRSDVAVAGDGEDQCVDVGDHRRLAIGGVVVERAPPLDLHGHGGEAGLVGVEQRADQTGQVEHERDHHERQPHPQEPPPIVERRPEAGSTLTPGPGRAPGARRRREAMPPPSPPARRRPARPRPRSCRSR